MTDINKTMLGDHEAAKRLTDAGVLLPCPMCGGNPTRDGSTKYALQNDCHLYAVRAVNEAPILSAEEIKELSHG